MSHLWCFKSNPQMWRPLDTNFHALQVLCKQDLFGMTMIRVGRSRVVFLSPDRRANFSSFALRFLAALAQAKDRQMFNHTFGVSSKDDFKTCMGK